MAIESAIKTEHKCLEINLESCAKPDGVCRTWIKTINATFWNLTSCWLCKYYKECVRNVPCGIFIMWCARNVQCGLIIEYQAKAE